MCTGHQQHSYLLLCFIRLAAWLQALIFRRLTLNLLTTTIVAPPSNASKWQMGFNSAFKGLNNTSQFSHNCSFYLVRLQWDLKLWVFDIQFVRPEGDHLVVETRSRATRLIEYTKQLLTVPAIYPVTYQNTMGRLWLKLRWGGGGVVFRSPTM
jgi:hypothetical protein